MGGGVRIIITKARFFWGGSRMLRAIYPLLFGMAGDGIGWGGRSFGNVPGMTG